MTPKGRFIKTLRSQPVDRVPCTAIGETTPTFNSRLCQAEYFWHAAESQGKRSISIATGRRSASSGPWPSA